MEKKLVLSLFSGLGGMDMGLEGLGLRVPLKSIKNKDWIEREDGNFAFLKKNPFETVFANDIKPDAQAVWERYFKRFGIFRLESIVDLVKQAKEWEIRFPEADLITGGFPCQDFSLAGKRKGFNSQKSHKNKAMDDTPSEESRGMLYMWMKSVIELVHPKAFIAENVKGLMSLDDAKEIIQKDFAACGYVVGARLLKVWEFGVPQSRERIIFIGLRADAMTQRAVEVFKKGEEAVIEAGMFPFPEPTHSLPNDIVTAIDALGDLPEPEDSDDPSHQGYSKAKFYRRKERTDQENGGKHRKNTGKLQGNTEINIAGLAPTIRSEHHGNIEFRRLSESHGGKNDSGLGHSERRLTVRECARIQTFPDSLELVGKGVSISNAYRLIGNAVPPLMAYHIGRRLAEVWDKVFVTKG
jgi:DNA (cytosine-5)-methyltransferase 1